MDNVIIKSFLWLFPLAVPYTIPYDRRYRPDRTLLSQNNGNLNGASSMKQFLEWLFFVILVLAVPATILIFGWFWILKPKWKLIQIKQKELDRVSDLIE